MTRPAILLAHITPRVPAALTFATWNPADAHADIALSGSDLVAEKATTDATAWSCVRATVWPIVGRWYWEVKIDFTGSPGFAVGIAIDWMDLDLEPGTLPRPMASIAVGADGKVRYNSAVFGDVGTINSGDVLRFWLDCDGRRMYVARSGGTWVELTNPGQGPVLVEAGISGAYPIAGIKRPSGSAVTITANFGDAPFAYTIPDGCNAGLYSQSAATDLPLYLSSSAFAEGAQQYDARIAGDSGGDVEIERRGSCYVWGRQSASQRGRIVLVNADGGLDAWAGYEWRDAPVELYAGYEGDDFASFQPWTYGRVDAIAFTDRNRVELSLLDPLAALDRPLQTHLYPDTQGNVQARGKPVPIVYGRPMYCTAVSLDTNIMVRDYQLTDTTTPLTSITMIYDSGDPFGGPDDSFTPHNMITSANGGDFTPWAGTPPLPPNWAALTPFGPHDRFEKAGAEGMRCWSTHTPATAIYHATTSMLADTRYRITFDVVGVQVPGVLHFLAAGVMVPFALTIAMNGTTQSTVIDVRDQAQLQLAMLGRNLDATIAHMRVTSEQILDWSYYTESSLRVGFTLDNQPVGRVVANPVSAVTTLRDLVDDVCNTRLALPAIGALPAVDLDSADVAGSSDQAPGGTPGTPYEIAAYLDRPVSALALLREALDSFCGWITTNRLGQIVFGRPYDPKLTQPGGRAVVMLDPTNIVGEVTVTDDLAKGLTLRLSGRRNHSPHQPSELATLVPPALAAELQSEMLATAVGAAPLGAGSVSPAYRQAVDAPAFPTMLQQPAELQAEANRIATLWRPARRFYRLTAILGSGVGDAVEPGDEALLVWPRLGLDTGRRLVVIGVRSRFFSRRVDIDLWG